jgi:hypothetical protein
MKLYAIITIPSQTLRASVVVTGVIGIPARAIEDELMEGAVGEIQHVSGAHIEKLLEFAFFQIGKIRHL